MSSRPVRVIVTVILGLAGIVLGVIGDWLLWHPIDGVMLTIGAGALLLVAGAVALIPRRAARTAALGVFAFGIGLIVGQVGSPGRPALDGAEGSVTVTLDQPAGPSGTHMATCQFSGTGDELQVSGDPNLRLDVLGPLPGAPADLDQRAFVHVSVTVGDRWPDGQVTRSDNVDLSLAVSSPAADKGETRLVASDASDIHIEWTQAGGTLRFAGLVEDPSGAPPPAGLDLRGTITWTCNSPAGSDG